MLTLALARSVHHRRNPVTHVTLARGSEVAPVLTNEVQHQLMVLQWENDMITSALKSGARLPGYTRPAIRPARSAAALDRAPSSISRELKRNRGKQVGYKPAYAYIWAPVGPRPLMVRDNRYASAYLFGAICPDRAVGAMVVMPEVNAEAMSHLLKAISEEVSPQAHAVLICDGAGWHQTGRRLRVPDSIALLPLPPYSPELNPMEAVWRYLRENSFLADLGHL